MTRAPFLPRARPRWAAARTAISAPCAGEPDAGDATSRCMMELHLLSLSLSNMMSGAVKQRDRAQRQPRADGQRTRGAILRAAASLATVDGLEGLSIGHLAAAIGMSKSGLYAHFGSKQELQLATVEEACWILDQEVPDSGTVAEGHLLSSSAHGASWLSGGATGPEGSVIVIPVVVLLVILVWRAFPRTAPVGLERLR